MNFIHSVLIWNENFPPLALEISHHTGTERIILNYNNNYEEVDEREDINKDSRVSH